MPDPRTLRIVAVATFLPAFPLCIAHGVISHDPTPAVGLVPLAFSAGASVFLLVRDSQRRRAAATAEGHAENGEHDQADAERAAAPAERPILVFLVDVILATALMVVLVITWITSPRKYHRGAANAAMLAAYATIPLLVNFLVHLYLAVRALHIGLAVQDLMQYVAWQAVPPECPNCNAHLRPDSAPEIPWFQSLPSVNDMRQWKLPAVKIKAPALKTPAWLKGPRKGYKPLFASQPAYADEPEEGAAESSHQAPEPGPVEAVAVVGKNKKGKATNVLADEPAGVWDA